MFIVGATTFSVTCLHESLIVMHDGSSLEASQTCVMASGSCSDYERRPYKRRFSVNRWGMEMGQTDPKSLVPVLAE
jgi:hypothetical protein